MDELFDNSLNYLEFTPAVDIYIQPNCQYLNAECLSPIIDSISLSILMLNIRSCCKNFDQFILTFCNHPSYFTCIILTETWLTQDRENILIVHGFYCVELYQNNYGGGIKIYVKDYVKVNVRKLLVALLSWFYNFYHFFMLKQGTFFSVHLLPQMYTFREKNY